MAASGRAIRSNSKTTGMNVSADIEVVNKLKSILACPISKIELTPLHTIMLACGSRGKEEEEQTYGEI
ncbi:hypothetical protein RRG08_032036 [Elysia crispata]|uniref:Uncharacterized protein n=1 Tax=Elysia crispata TaxID=231223 RepID=A0AAE0XVH0_9GAST|nr:hypothetical protein RRG08_032036 [Elysia crispata]